MLVLGEFDIAFAWRTFLWKVLFTNCNVHLFMPKVRFDDVFHRLERERVRRFRVRQKQKKEKAEHG